MRVLRALRGRELFQLRLFLVGAGLLNVAIYLFWARRAVEHILHPAQPCPHAPKSLALFPLQSGSQSPLVGAALLISRPWAVRDV